VEQAPAAPPLPVLDTAEENGSFSFDAPNPFNVEEDNDDKQKPEFRFESMAPDEPAAEEQLWSSEPTNQFNQDTQVPAQSVSQQPDTENPPPAIEKDKAKTSKLMLFVLIIILVIAGIYGYCFITMGTTDVKQMIDNLQNQVGASQQQGGGQEQGQIHVDTSESYYVDNASAGQLFIIEGKVTNGFSSARSELKVIGTLYKEQGTPLLNQSAYCGNLISKNDLKTEPLTALINQMNNPFGAALTNVNIAPGQKVPFMIVFSKIPENLNEFSVEAESSKAAAK
jgi:cell division protein FtsL